MQTVISSLIALAGIWVVLVHGYRSYSVYRHRLVLFTLRDELFNVGADGVIPFTAPAYTRLRDLLNAHIRFADRMDAMFGLILTLLVGREFRRQGAVLEQDWKSAVGSLDVEARKRIETIRHRMQLELIRQFVLGELLWVPFMLAILLCLVAMSAVMVFMRSPAMLIRGTKHQLEHRASITTNELDAAALCTS